MARQPLEAMWSGLDVEGPARIEWVRRVDGPRLVMLLGAFDPPTRAHVSIARAAGRAEKAPAVFCLTKVLLARGGDELLPPVERLRLLDRLAARHDFGVAIGNRGTYLEISRALQAMEIEATFVIGSDKLAQLADPSFYPDGDAGVSATFAEVRLLTVPRPGADIQDDASFRWLDPADVFEDPTEMTVSATEVRRLIRDGAPVDALVPREVADFLAGYTAAR